MLRDHIAQNVRRLRLEAGLTQDKLAVIAGISSVKMIESGRRGSLPTLEKIAEALSSKLGRVVSVEDLVRAEVAA